MPRHPLCGSTKSSPARTKSRRMNIQAVRQSRVPPGIETRFADEHPPPGGGHRHPLCGCRTPRHPPGFHPPPGLCPGGAVRQSRVPLRSRMNIQAEDEILRAAVRCEHLTEVVPTALLKKFKKSKKDRKKISEFFLCQQ